MSLTMSLVKMTACQSTPTKSPFVAFLEAVDGHLINLPRPFREQSTKVSVSLH